MNKIWFISIDQKIDGPWAYEELKSDRRLTPDTWVWKEGFEDWKKIRDVPELDDLFVRDSKEAPDDEQQPELKPNEPGQDELAIEAGREPPYLFWIILALIILIYTIVQMYS
jgi:hypothetical protein